MGVYDPTQSEGVEVGPMGWNHDAADGATHGGISPALIGFEPMSFEPAAPTVMPALAPLPAPANLHGRLGAMLPLAYRLAYRLLGHPGAAMAVAGDALRSAAGADPAAIATEVTRAVAEQIVRHRSQIASSVPLTAPSVTYASQRSRLCRDLARHEADERLVLVMRHLSGLSPARVASLLDLDEGSVRRITARWTPEDAATDSGAMLAGIDNWISEGLAERDTAPEVATLDHLDDPAPPRFRAITVDELPTIAQLKNVRR